MAVDGVVVMCNCAMLKERRYAVRAGWIRIYGQQKRRQRCWLRVRNAEAQARPGWRQSGRGGGWVGPSEPRARLAAWEITCAAPSRNRTSACKHGVGGALSTVGAASSEH